MSNTITGTFVCIQPSQLPHCPKIEEALVVRELRLACIVKPDTRCYKNASFSALHRAGGAGGPGAGFGYPPDHYKDVGTQS